MNGFMPVLDVNLFLDFLKLNILDYGHRFLRPFAVEGLLKTRKRDVLRFHLAAARSGDRNRYGATHPRRKTSESVDAIACADDPISRYAGALLSVAGTE